MLTTVALMGAVLAATPRGPEHAWVLGAQHARDYLLVTPAPWPPHRVDDASRPEVSREWVSRFPIGSRTPMAEQTVSDPGAAHYGASGALANHLIVSRIGHTAIAVDPWTTIEGRGSLERMEIARSQWLREQGYVLHVRTHRNPAASAAAERVATAAAPDAATSEAPAEMKSPTIIRPRAILRVRPDEPHPKRDRLRVMGPAKVVEPSVQATAIHADAQPERR